MQSLMNSKQEVTVTDIKMPFTSMVIFMLKWTLASIPAILIIAIVGTLVAAVFGIFFSNLSRNLQSIPR
jgi:hypothetical protein